MPCSNSTTTRLQPVSLTEYLEHGGRPTPEIYRGRGLARMRLGDYPGAVDDYTRALELQPDGEIQAHRGWAYFFSDSPRLALRDFEEAVRLNPDDSEACVGRGLARVALGHYRVAVADAEDALGRRINSPEMLHNAACIFARAAGLVQADREQSDAAALARHYRERAVETIGRALDRVPSEERAAFWRGKIAPDPYLDAIRNSREFVALAARMDGDAGRQSAESPAAR